jgi:hypothetical protein
MRKRLINNMNRIIMILFIAIFFQKALAQSPQAIPYQAIVRNASGNIISNQAVKLRFSMHDSLATGAIVYKELHTTSTNTQGLVNVNIGKGTLLSGTFSEINWGKNYKFIQVELDALNNNTYTDLGTTQMMSVPYALYAEKTGTSSGFQHYVGEVFGGGVIFHLLKDSNRAEHGLIISTIDLGNTVWGTEGLTIPNAMNFYDGSMNTLSIINNESISNNAAHLCSIYRGGGYNDWYLPSIEELLLIYENRYNLNYTLKNIVGSNSIYNPNPQSNNNWTQSYNYWSSTQFVFESNTYAYNLAYNLTTGGTPVSVDNGPKSTILTVRAIRKF